MKKFTGCLYLLGIAIGLMGLIAACTQADESDVVAEKGEMQPVTIRIQTESDLYLQRIPDNMIYTLRVYAFDMTGGNARPEGYYYHADPNGITSVSFSMNLPMGSQIYVVANEDQAGTLRDATHQSPVVLPGEKVHGTLLNDAQGIPSIDITPDQLKDLTFSKWPEAKLTSGNPNEVDEAKKTYEEVPVPMTGYGEVVANKGGNKAGNSLLIPLKRSVAKLTLNFAKAGLRLDTLYLGRGVYLYNIPDKGFLFPRTLDGLKAAMKPVGPGKPAIQILYREDQSVAGEEEHQSGGWPILHSGLGTAREPVNPGKPPLKTDPAYKDWEMKWTAYHQEIIKTHINEITAANNTPSSSRDTKLYESMPRKSFYLFANPYTTPANTPPNRDKTYKGETDGYYLQIRSHEHITHYEGGHETAHRGEVQYVALPPVEANQHWQLNSIIRLSGYTGVQVHWVITDWNRVDLGIDFN